MFIMFIIPFLPSGSVRLMNAASLVLVFESYSGAEL